MTKEKLSNCAGFVKSSILGCKEQYVIPQDILDVSEEVSKEEAQFVVFLDKKVRVIHLALYSYEKPNRLIQRDSYDGDISILFYANPVSEMELDSNVTIQFRRFTPISRIQ